MKIEVLEKIDELLKENEEFVEMCSDPMFLDSNKCSEIINDNLERIKNLKIDYLFEVEMKKLERMDL